MKEKTAEYCLLPRHTNGELHTKLSAGAKNSQNPGRKKKRKLHRPDRIRGRHMHENNPFHIDFCTTARFAHECFSWIGHFIIIFFIISLVKFFSASIYTNNINYWKYYLISILIIFVAACHVVGGKRTPRLLWSQYFKVDCTRYGTESRDP